MDIKLSIDGGFSLTDGDFTKTTSTEEVVLVINKIVKGWLDGYSILKFAGQRNNRETAKIIKQDLERELRKYVSILSCRVIPLDTDKIAITIGITGGASPLYQTIFNYSNGIIKYIENEEMDIIYREKTNSYI